MISKTGRIFLKILVLSSALVLLLALAIDSHSPALAQARTNTVNVSIYGEVNQRFLVSDAEALAAQTISDRFRQDPSLEAIELTVLGDRNGEIVPLLSVFVSRNQWQTTPQVSTWAEYNNASYALLQRHEEAAAANSDLDVAAGRQTPSSSSRGRRPIDTGLPSGPEAQIQLSDLD